MPATQRRYSFVFVAMILVLVSGCATLSDLAQLKEPKISLRETRLANLNFTSATIILDLEIKNSNLFALSLAGFDYDLAVNGHSTFKGDKASRLSIPAQGVGRIDLPVTVEYAELFKAIGSLKDQESFKYNVACGLKFDVPVLGGLRIPLKTEGTLPIVKMPKISMAGLHIKKLDFTQATLVMDLTVDNPNVFDILVRSLKYGLVMNGTPWASGSVQDDSKLWSKRQNTVSIPLTVDFLKVGKSMQSLFTGREVLNFKLDGDMDLAPSNKGFAGGTIPLKDAGKVLLTR